MSELQNILRAQIDLLDNAKSRHVAGSRDDLDWCDRRDIWIAEAEKALASSQPSVAEEPVAWRYRWKIDGEWTNWRVADASQKSRHLPSLEEIPLYAAMQPQQALGWRPIESAPRDTFLILGHYERKWIRFGKWYLQEKCWYYSRSQYTQVRGDEPTHWMPMPAPPGAALQPQQPVGED